MIGLTRGLWSLDESAHIKMLLAESFENLITKGLIHLGVRRMAFSVGSLGNGKGVGYTSSSENSWSKQSYPSVMIPKYPSNVT